MSEEDPTPEELREAEALARALDGQLAETAAPPEALEAAAFLRHAGSELDPNHAAALAARLRAGVQRSRRRPWLWLLAPLVAGATAAALCVPARKPGPPPLTALPPPGAALLAAQAGVARGQGQALDALDSQMRAYRREVFRRLREAR